MDRISIKNLRSLVDVKDIEIKPITVLVGKNSSGKSTFLRTFPLLKQTIETRISVPILWYEENYVDFGDFHDSLSRYTNEDFIQFSFEFNLKDMVIFDKRYSHIRFNHSVGNYIVRIELIFNESYIQKLNIKYGDQYIHIKYEKNGTVAELYINDSELNTKNYEWKRKPTSLIPYLSKANEIDALSSDYFFEEFINILMQLSHKSTKRETIVQATQDIIIGNKMSIFKSLSEARYPSYLHDKLVEIPFNSSDFSKINDLIVASFLESILDSCNKLIENTARSVKYIKPIRANVDRYYRMQGLYVDEIDASGQNIPMFLHNLSESEKFDFEIWTKELFGLKFSTSSKEGHVSLIMKDDLTGESYNLADTGYGFSQMLPIIVLLWQTSEKKEKLTIQPNKYRRTMTDINEYLLVIEQPELHLHPALQAKLVDIFAKIVSETNKNQHRNIRVVFETHSETMINRLGYLISKNMLDKSDVNVLIFNKNDYQETIIKSAEYSQKGMLQGWPLGFFAPEKL